MQRSRPRSAEPATAVTPSTLFPLGSRLTTFLVMVVPFLGLGAAIALLWGVGFDWVHLGLLVGGYVATGLGITVGYHRLFTHKSFEAGPFLTALLGVLGSMAAQGPILDWVSIHRRHHQHSDTDDDPHSPNTQGGGFVGTLRGLFHAHVGWCFKLRVNAEDMGRYVPDLRADALVRRLNALFPLWVVLGLLIPAGIALAVTGSWQGALLGLIWGGLVRIFFIHHVTWSINSACHLWGARPFVTHDHSRNNVVFAVLGLGEGWHNNHHAFPASARHGLRWWQFDLGYLVIRALAGMGLARNVRVPSSERIDAKLAR